MRPRAAGDCVRSRGRYSCGILPACTRKIISPFCMCVYVCVCVFQVLAVFFARIFIYSFFCGFMMRAARRGSGSRVRPRSDVGRGHARTRTTYTRQSSRRGAAGGRTPGVGHLSDLAPLGRSAEDNWHRHTDTMHTAHRRRKEKCTGPVRRGPWARTGGRERGEAGEILVVSGSVHYSLPHRARLPL